LSKKQIRPFFFTSICKSGTHLLTTFFGACGLSRASCHDRELMKALEHDFLARNAPDLYRKTLSSAPRLRETKQEVKSAIAQTLEAFDRLGPGRYMFNHVSYSPELAKELRKRGVPIIFLYRDPRDVAISLMNYTMKEGTDVGQFLSAIPNVEDRVEAVIQGRAGFPLRIRFEPFEGWLTEPDVLVVHHASLIGPRGGGSAIAQHKAHRWIANHIGLNLTDEELSTAYNRVYSEEARMFSVGRTRQWRSIFGQRARSAFEQEMGDKAAKWFEDIPFPQTDLAQAASS
jgi:hypothetical protein